jgi:hypothetical protein
MKSVYVVLAFLSSLILSSASANDFFDITCSTKSPPHYMDYFIFTGEFSGDVMSFEALQIKNGNLIFLAKSISAAYEETTSSFLIKGKTISGEDFAFEIFKTLHSQIEGKKIYNAEYSIKGGRRIIADTLLCLEKEKFNE